MAAAKGMGSAAMRSALQNLQSKLTERDESLKVMVGKAIRRPLRSKTKKTSPEAKRLAYESRIKASLSAGLDGFTACSLLAWQSGKPVLAAGQYARIKWCLTKETPAGILQAAVVSYDRPQTISEGVASHLGVVPLQQLEACNCGGYLHRQGCKPHKHHE